MSLQEPIIIGLDEQVLEKDYNQYALEIVAHARFSLNVGCGGGRFETHCLGDINIDIAKPRQKPCKPFIQKALPLFLLGLVLLIIEYLIFSESISANSTSKIFSFNNSTISIYQKHST